MWVVGIFGILFNSVGALDYLMTQTHNASYMGRLTPVQLEVLYGLPIWLVVAWGLAVLGGALGAVLMLFRRSLAVPVLLVSLLGMTVTAIHNFSSATGLYETAGTGAGFVLFIFVFALGLWLYAWAQRKRGLLV